MKDKAGSTNYDPMDHFYEQRPDLRPLKDVIQLFQPGALCPRCQHYLSGYGVSRCLVKPERGTAPACCTDYQKRLY